MSVASPKCNSRSPQWRAGQAGAGARACPVRTADGGVRAADNLGGAPGAPRALGDSAFTLLELLLATAIFAIVLVAINTVFFAGMRLRRTVSEAVEQVAPLNEALTIMRRDLQNAVPPGGTLAGDFRSGGPASSSSSGMSRSTGSGSMGSSGSTSSSSGGQNGGLDFFTSTGVLNEEEPWGDIQEVNYQLMEPEDQPNGPGKDLVRSVTRNLLAASTQTAEIQRLVSNVESLDFFYYDGTQWRDTWDTSTSDPGLPTAVRVRIQLATTNLNTDRNLEPLEMLVLLTAQSATNQAQTTTGGGQ